MNGLVGIVANPHDIVAVHRPRRHVGLAVHEHDYLRGLEQLLLALVLRRKSNAVLEDLSHIVQVIHVVCLSTRTVKDDDGLGIVCMNHVGKLAAKLDGIVVVNEVVGKRALSGVTLRIHHDKHLAVILCQKSVKRLLLPLAKLDRVGAINWLQHLDGSLDALVETDVGGGVFVSNVTGSGAFLEAIGNDLEVRSLALMRLPGAVFPRAVDTAVLLHAIVARLVFGALARLPVGLLQNLLARAEALGTSELDVPLQVFGALLATLALPYGISHICWPLDVVGGRIVESEAPAANLRHGALWLAPP